MFKTADFTDEVWRLKHENEELKKKLEAYEQEYRRMRYDLDIKDKDTELGKALRTILKEVGK